MPNVFQHSVPSFEWLRKYKECKGSNIFKLEVYNTVIEREVQRETIPWSRFISMRSFWSTCPQQGTPAEGSTLKLIKNWDNNSNKKHEGVFTVVSVTCCTVAFTRDVASALLFAWSNVHPHITEGHCGQLSLSPYPLQASHELPRRITWNKEWTIISGKILIS